jgi:hypothetical protein
MIGPLALVAALLVVTPAHAQMTVAPKDTSKSPPPATSAPWDSANYFLPYCVSETKIPPNYRYELRGFCSGVIYSIMVVMRQLKWACLPEEITVDQARGVAVRYISARPERMHEPFINLASEAIEDAWPCKQ